MNNKYFVYKNESKDISKIIGDIKHYCDRYNLEETQNANEADLIISVGGDGTFLEAAKCSIGKPIFGINKGTLGYLTEVQADRFDAAITDFVNGNYQLKKRMMLNSYVEHENKYFSNYPFALNDVVISKNGSSVIGVDIFVDDTFIKSYLADGIIISTPTGSTGYSLSCGGPIVEPNSENIIITPVAPHTIINRSLVLSSESRIEIKLKRVRNDDKKASLMVDGENFDIFENDVLTVYKSKEYTNIISFSEASFLEKVQQKMILDIF